MMRWLGERVIALAIRKPYRKGHIYGPDGSLYMRRFSLFETRWLSARVHHIAREDNDRHMHDHPWSFASWVLRGSYIERRPMETNPCFVGDSELTYATARGTGSVAFRRATDRHLISQVAPDTWSLFIYGPVRQWWGFYTPEGKVYFADYLSRLT